MSTKLSVKAAARDAKRAEQRLLSPGTPLVNGVPALDNFVNFAQKMGVGADNPLSAPG